MRGVNTVDLKEIAASCLFDGRWNGNAETENQRNFLKVRKKLNKLFVERYGENNGYRGWWLDGMEIWRADWAGRDSAMVCLHIKKQEEKEDILFYGVEGLYIKGDLQPPGSRWAAEVLLLAFAEERKELHCALVCREGFTIRMRFAQVISVEKGTNMQA
jgi:hypothetical protein